LPNAADFVTAAVTTHLFFLLFQEVPLGQEQLEDPAADVIESGQSVQLPAPTVEYVSAGQLVQADAPADEYIPAGQSVQVEMLRAPVFDE